MTDVQEQRRDERHNEIRQPDEEKAYENSRIKRSGLNDPPFLRLALTCDGHGHEAPTRHVVPRPPPFRRHARVR